MTGLTIGLLGALAVVFGWRGVRRLRRAHDHLDSVEGALSLVRGFRGVLIAAGSIAYAAGLLADSDIVRLIALVIVAEELYETTMAELLLRAARKAAREPAVA